MTNRAPKPRFMTIDTTVPKERAVLVGVTLPKTTDAETEDSLAELGRLAKTLGYEVVGTLSQRRGSLAGAVVLGAGKLKELARFTGGKGVLERKSYAKKTKAAARFEGAEDEDETDQEFEDLEDEDEDEFEEEVEGEEDPPEIEADVVIFDCELSPSQLSNLETATGVEVYDRTGVIVEIFHRHARSARPACRSSWRASPTSRPPARGRGPERAPGRPRRR
jgi:GTP-binding protein HflX